MLVLFTGFFNPLPKWGEPRSRGNHTAIILFHFGELYSDWAGRKLLSSYIYLYNICNYSLKTHMEASKSCHCKPWGKSIFENQSVVWLRWVFDGSFRETSSDDLDHLYGAPELLVTGSRHQSLIRWEIVLRSLHVLLFDEWVLSWIMKPVLLKLWFAM